MSLFCRNNRAFKGQWYCTDGRENNREGCALNRFIKDTGCKQQLIRSCMAIIRSSATSECLLTLPLKHLLSLDHHKTLLQIAINIFPELGGFWQITRSFPSINSAEPSLVCGFFPFHLTNCFSSYTALGNELFRPWLISDKGS